MSEAELIEIEQRFRYLGRMLDKADVLLADRERYEERQCRNWSGESEYAIRQWGRAKVKLDEVVALREDVKKALEVSGSDLQQLVEEYRSHGVVA